MPSSIQLFWGMLFGAVGMGYFIYGKKQKVFVPLACGLILMVYPYFISNTIVLVLVGLIVSALPYFFRF